MMLEYLVEPTASEQPAKRRLQASRLDHPKENDPSSGARTGAIIHRM